MLCLESQALQFTGDCMIPLLPLSPYLPRLLFPSFLPSSPRLLPSSYLSFNVHLSFLPHSPSFLPPPSSFLPPPSSPIRPSLAAFLTQTVNLDDTTVKFEIWDTAGQERYHSLAPMYYRGAQAAIVVYDITNNVRSLCCLVAHSQLCFALTHSSLAVLTMKDWLYKFMQTLSAMKCDQSA